MGNTLYPDRGSAHRLIIPDLGMVKTIAEGYDLGGDDAIGFSSSTRMWELNHFK